MKKSTKGALASGAAAVLLLGGATSLAYWSDSATVDGGEFNSGHLSLDPVAGTGCDGWVLDSGEDAPGVPYTPDMDLVPGDVLTQSCEFTLNVSGEHMRGTVEATPATAPTGELAPYLDVATDGMTINGTPTASAEFTETNNGDLLGVDISVTFDPTTGDDTTDDTPSMDVSAVLDTITVTATQIHS